jgi:hypothetical protein
MYVRVSLPIRGEKRFRYSIIKWISMSSSSFCFMCVYYPRNNCMFTMSLKWNFICCCCVLLITLDFVVLVLINLCLLMFFLILQSLFFPQFIRHNVKNTNKPNVSERVRENNKQNPFHTHICTSFWLITACLHASSAP